MKLGRYLVMHNFYTYVLSFLILLGIKYSVISSTHHCEHTEGGYPARCRKTDGSVMNVGECEDKCTSFNWCIAYSYGGFDFLGFECALITSTGSCSNEWTFTSGSIAKNISDLKPSNRDRFNCAVKGILQDFTY